MQVSITGDINRCILHEPRKEFDQYLSYLHTVVAHQNPHKNSFVLTITRRRIRTIFQIHFMRSDEMDIKYTNIPTTLYKDLNSILLSWDHLIEEYNWDPQQFSLLVKSKYDWNYLYSGSNTQYHVKDLEPSTSYTFQLEIHNGDDQVDNIKFKACTDFEPYHNFHIIRAITQGKTSLLRKVVNQRPLLLELENKQNKTPLASVAETGDLAMATFLITLGANINTPLMWIQRTPLMISLFNGNLQIAALLLDKGADTSIRDCNGLTAMHYAIDSGEMENVKFAVEHGLDINARDNKGWTGLLRAVVMENSDEMVEYLMGNGADLNVKDKNGFDFHKHCELSGRNVKLS